MRQITSTTRIPNCPLLLLFMLTFGSRYSTFPSPVLSRDRWDSRKFCVLQLVSRPACTPSGKTISSTTRPDVTWGKGRGQVAPVEAVPNKWPVWGRSEKCGNRHRIEVAKLFSVLYLVRLSRDSASALRYRESNRMFVFPTLSRVLLLVVRLAFVLVLFFLLSLYFFFVFFFLSFSWSLNLCFLWFRVSSMKSSECGQR